MATITAAVLRGAHIVRVHDVKAAVETVRVAESLRSVPTCGSGRVNLGQIVIGS